MGGKVRMGEVLRYARPYSPVAPTVDGLPNYFHRVNTPDRPLPLLEAGINTIQALGKGQAPPAILISSSPHKEGSEATPWQDFFRPDYGHIRYFGDNRSVDQDPANTRGNALLLRAFEMHGSPDLARRKAAAPVIFFRRVRVGDRSKGNVQFNGFGLVERVERIVQIDPSTDLPFANYVYDFAVLSLADENEQFDWSWIDARRDPNFDLDKSLELAPKAWRRWVSLGSTAIESSRRKVSKLMTIPPATRKLDAESKEGRLLKAIYDYYDGRKGRFEALAAFIAGRILSATGDQYVPGWITPASGDGGADFVGRVDLGNDMARVKIVVLGQAKCESFHVPTNGNHIARTVARLKRGWLGVYVTTSYFSEAVQREVIDDQYPIMLIDGHRIAMEIGTVLLERNIANVSTFLDDIDQTYGGSIARRSPEEILLI